jgi:hypothetical protein
MDDGQTLRPWRVHAAAQVGAKTKGETMSAVSITINRIPTARFAYDAASDAAKVQSEIFERLLELDEMKHDRGADLCRRLATLADLSAYAYRMVLSVGSGNLESVLSSYESMAERRGLTKQAIHYEFQAELKKVQYLFPEIAAVLHQYRDHATRHHRNPTDGEGIKEARQ